MAEEKKKAVKKAAKKTTKKKNVRKKTVAKKSAPNKAIKKTVEKKEVVENVRKEPKFFFEYPVKYFMSCLCGEKIHMLTAEKGDKKHIFFEIGQQYIYKCTSCGCEHVFMTDGMPEHAGFSGFIYKEKTNDLNGSYGVNLGGVQTPGPLPFDLKIYNRSDNDKIKNTLSLKIAINAEKEDEETSSLTLNFFTE